MKQRAAVWANRVHRPDPKSEAPPTWRIVECEFLRRYSDAVVGDTNFERREIWLWSPAAGYLRTNEPPFSPAPRD